MLEKKNLVSNKESDIVDKFKDVDAGHNFEEDHLLLNSMLKAIIPVGRN